MAWLPPLVLLVFDDLLVRRTRSPRRLGVILGLLGFVQLLTTEEILATTAICGVHRPGDPGRPAAVADPGRPAAPRHGPRGRRGHPRRSSARGRSRSSSWVRGGSPRRLIDLREFSTDLLNLVVPTSYQLFAPPEATRISADFSGLFHEADAYLGLPLIVVLAVVVVLGRRDMRVRTAADRRADDARPVDGLRTSWSAAHRPGIPLPWVLASGLPILEDVIASRFIVFTWLAVAILVGFGCERALRGTLRQAAAAGRGPWAGARRHPAGAAPFEHDHGPGVLRALGPGGHAPRRHDPVRPVLPRRRRRRPDALGGDRRRRAADGRGVRLRAAARWAGRRTGRARPSSSRSWRRSRTPTDVAIVARGAVRDQVAADIRAKGITDVIVGPMVRPEGDARASSATCSAARRRPSTACGSGAMWTLRGVSPAP